MRILFRRFMVFSKREVIFLKRSTRFETQRQRSTERGEAGNILKERGQNQLKRYNAI